MAKNKLRPKDRQVEIEEREASSLEDIDMGMDALKEHDIQIEKTKKTVQIENKKTTAVLVKQRMKGVMDGSIVLKDSLQTHWKLIFFCFVLCLLLIANNYFSETMVRETTQIKRELKELRFSQISTKAERMLLARQSSIAKRLDSTGIKESVVPPIKIIYKGK
ncbi:MAG: FtsL-like putative cell division protein [Bacteroidales bacterium]